MSKTVKDLVSKNYRVVDENLSPEEARRLVQSQTCGVILDDDKHPLALVGEAALRAAAAGHSDSLNPHSGEFPPTILVSGDTPLQELNESGILSLLKLGALGAIVIEDEAIAGVLPRERLEPAVDEEAPLPEIKRNLSYAPGDSILPGEHQNIVGIVRCRECRYDNRIFYLDPDDLPQCQNPDYPPHRLKVQ